MPHRIRAVKMGNLARPTMG